jgi:hypothetical protein
MLYSLIYVKTEEVALLLYLLTYAKTEYIALLLYSLLYAMTDEMQCYYTRLHMPRRETLQAMFVKRVNSLWIGALASDSNR